MKRLAISLILIECKRFPHIPAHAIPNTHTHTRTQTQSNRTHRRNKMCNFKRINRYILNKVVQYLGTPGISNKSRFTFGTFIQSVHITFHSVSYNVIPPIAGPEVSFRERIAMPKNSERICFFESWLGMNLGIYLTRKNEHKIRIWKSNNKIQTKTF